MTTNELYKLFCKQFTNNAGRKERRYIEQYGDIPFEEAFPIYLENINAFIGRKKRIEKFENFLKKKGCKRVDSKQSESRYYYFENKKYRFSGHIYPTGSMTDLKMGIIDLAADPELIDNINF